MNKKELIEENNLLKETNEFLNQELIRETADKAVLLNRLRQIDKLIKECREEGLLD